MSFANSGGGLPSPSTSIGPFLIKGDPSKLTSSVSLVTNSGDAELKETSSKLPPHSSYVISTSGLSPPYLLGESDGPDGNHNQVSTTDFCESRVTEEPSQRLVKAVSVRSLPYKSLSASISDMESVVRLIDSTVGSKPSNGSRSAIGEDLGEWLNLFNKEKSWAGILEKTNCIGVVESNICASSCKTDSFNELTDPYKFDESTGTSHNKRPRSVVKCTLSHEIREINQRLIDTVVDISEEVVDSTCETPETEGSQGTIVSYAAASQSLIGTRSRNYADCSPVLLDKLPTEVSFGYEDLSVKAKSKEYAHQLNGGRNFSLTNGTWEDHLSTAWLLICQSERK